MVLLQAGVTAVPRADCKFRAAPAPSVQSPKELTYQLSRSSPIAILVSLAQLFLVPVCAEQPCCAKLGNHLSLDSPHLARSFCSHAPLQGPLASPPLPSASLLARLRPSSTLPDSTLASQHFYHLAVQNFLKLWINK